MQPSPFAIPYSQCLTEAFTELTGQFCGLAPNEDASLSVDGEELILGVISVVGNVDWTLFLGLPRATAEALAKGFAGMAVPFDSADMADAVCEIMNVLAGMTIKRLEAHGVAANISLPDTLRGVSTPTLVPDDLLVYRKTRTLSDGHSLWLGLLAESYLRTKNRRSSVAHSAARRAS
ncbi:MAG: chemotaxis protein CheX [Planctomycetota bacterium]|jgi:CheY-specific phosphatase CheX